MGEQRCPAVEEALGGPGVATLYGEAGAGKTSLALYMSRLLCGPRPCYYVSSEGLGFLERASGLGIPLESLTVTEVFDLLDLAEALVGSPIPLYRYQLVVVDSVNYPYRRMVGEEGAYTLFSYILAYTYSLAERYASSFILTAQVHLGGEEGLEPVGRGALWMWSNVVARVERRGPQRALVFEKPRSLDGAEAVFEITEAGVVWLECP